MTGSPDLGTPGTPAWWLSFHQTLRSLLSPSQFAKGFSSKFPERPRDLLVVGKAASPLHQGIVSGCPQIMRSLGVLPHRSARQSFGNGEFLLAEHPVPSLGSFQASDRVKSWIRAGSREKELLVGLTGGTSALLADPAPGLTHQTKRECHQAMLASGLSIHEINTIRRHLSGVKGGNLLRLACENYSHVRLMVISDVPGDAFHEIGSGPFSPDPSTFGEALAVASSVPGFPVPALQHLERGACGEIPETLKPGEIPTHCFSATVLAGSIHAKTAATNLLQHQGFDVQPFPLALTGSPERFVDSVLTWLATSKPLPGIWWAASGETEIAIPAEVPVGKGGRASTLALRLGLAFKNAVYEADLAVIATDGADGNSHSGGGFIPGDLLCANSERESAESALDGFDAAGFLASRNCLFPGFPGESNFGDLLLFRLR